MPKDPTVVCGAIVNVATDFPDGGTYIPFPLPTGTRDAYDAMGAEQLLSLLPDDFPVFCCFADAQLFLLNMWTLLRQGFDAVDTTVMLCEAHGGFWDKKSHYYLEGTSPSISPN